MAVQKNIILESSFIPFNVGRAVPAEAAFLAVYLLLLQKHYV